MTERTIDMFATEAVPGIAPAEAFEPERGRCMVLQGDSSEPLPFRDDTFDSVITDPPYGFKFMGKKWDYDIPSVSAFAEQLRVAKPGATLLCFAGPRTQHRMACNIEDAGWRLWDTILWVFGSGFPKAAAIPKQIDLEIGAVWIVEDSEGERLYEWQIDGKIFRDKSAPDAVSDQAKFWLGQKSHGLKPAYEPVICAMKPNEGTYAENALEHGVSGLAIDRGRIGVGLTIPGGGKSKRGKQGQGIYGNGEKSVCAEPHTAGRFPSNLILGCACESPPPHEPGCACAMLDEQSGESVSRRALRGKSGIWNQGKGEDTIGRGHDDEGGSSRYFKQITPDTDDGSPDTECRMRYHSKASRRERDAGLEDMPIATPGEITGGRKEGSAGLSYAGAGAGHTGGGRNTHPTTKPLDLMRYLCRLTATPTGGLVLDPYAGSGTTGLAAVLEGRDCVLIERESEYVDIAKRRVK